MELKSLGIKLYKEDFKFNAAHFICESCDREQLHGHNYHLSVKIKSNLNIQIILLNWMKMDT